MDILANTIFYGTIVIGILVAIWGSKKRSFVVQCIGINFMTLPLAYFIGTMGYGGPNSTWKDFATGFFFIQTIPLALLAFATIKQYITKKA